MIEPGTLVTYRSTVRGRVVDIIPDVHGTYYAIEVTSIRHPLYARGTEILVSIDSPWLKENENGNS